MALAREAATRYEKEMEEYRAHKHGLSACSEGQSEGQSEGRPDRDCELQAIDQLPRSRSPTDSMDGPKADSMDGPKADSMDGPKADSNEDGPLTTDDDDEPHR